MRESEHRRARAAGRGRRCSITSLFSLFSTRGVPERAEGPARSWWTVTSVPADARPARWCEPVLLSSGKCGDKAGAMAAGCRPG